MKDQAINIIKKAKKEKLKKIDLNGLGLCKIPKELFELTDLDSIFLSNNNLKKIPKEICKLKKLRYINLSKNNISEIPNFIIDISSLSEIFLSSNDFITFPKILLSLKKLTSLSLSSNNIQSLPQDIVINKSLKDLFLSNNQIKNIPKNFIKNLSLDTIDLSGNPLTEPPIEIATSGLPAIRNYFESIDEFKDTYKIFEAKLLIVGEGDAGKTCLMRRLLNPKIVNIDTIKTTRGIEINQWFIKTKQINDLRINFWDFGGQEIYHSTHQFFLTKRSLYLFVWTARKDDNIVSFDYWLNVIKLLSDNAPVIVILNKIDERIKMIDENAIQSKFPNIKIFHKTSAKTGEGIDELKELIRKEVEKLPHIGDKVPKVWIDIRRHLESLDKNYISKKEYLKICGNFQLNEQQSLFLSLYFHDLGIFLHFQDNIILDNIIFLKPEWATNAVYKVVDTKEIQKKYGEFNLDNLKSIWSEYDEDDYIKLIELMKKFELCFKLDRKSYLAPGLLSEEKPEKAYNWKIKDNLCFDYQYNFMPSGLVTRFIVRNHDLIDKNIFWKNGVIISRTEILGRNTKNIRNKEVEETKAIIESKPLERKVAIKIYGKNKGSLLSVIRREFDYIHKTLNYPTVQEMIPCNCSYCSSAKEKNFYEYSTLKIYLENREHDIFCIYGKKRVNISNLIQRMGPSSKRGVVIENININGIANIADTIN